MDIQIISSLLWRRLKNSTAPFFCTYLVTWRCNAKCKMCGIWKKDAGIELNLDEIKQVFKQFNTIKVLRLSGGEPFMREDFIELVTIIRKVSSARIIHVTTNGLLSKQIVEFANIHNSKHIHLKLSWSSNINFALTVDALSRIKNGKIKIGINHTITDWESYLESTKIRSMCSFYKLAYLPALAYKVTALYDLPINSRIKNPSLELWGAFTKEQLKIILSDFLEGAKSIKDFKERRIKLYYLQGLYNRLVLNIDKPNPQCQALSTHLRILPNGDIPVCLYNSAIVGNAKTQIDLVKLLLMLNIVNRCSGCWANCEIIPSALFSERWV